MHGVVLFTGKREELAHGSLDLPPTVLLLTQAARRGQRVALVEMLRLPEVVERLAARFPGGGHGGRPE